MFIFCLNLKGGGGGCGYTMCAINEIYQQLTGTRVQEAMRQKKHAGNGTGLATTFEVHNQFRESRTKLERDLQILRLIRTNLVVDVLGGYSRKGLREPAGVTYHHARKNCYKKSVNQHARLIAFMPAFLFLFILVKQTH